MLTRTRALVVLVGTVAALVLTAPAASAGSEWVSPPTQGSEWV